MSDTPQDRRLLRQFPHVRRVRQRFPKGTRVQGVVGGWQGTVIRHVPGSNAQGGSLRIQWDNGNVGRVSPSTVTVLTEETP